MKKISKKTQKALSILLDHPNITARAFGDFYFTEPEHEYLYTACSKQGNGACRGKKLWLCTGSLLGRLIQKGYVRRYIDKYGKTTFSLTYDGMLAVKSSHTKTL